MNNFIKASEIERQKMESLFNKYGVTDFTFTPSDSYISYDGEYTNSKQENIVFETKVRNVSSKQYKTTIIEEFKLDQLLKSDKTPYVFVFFNDNTFLVHKIKDKNSYTISKQFAPKTTMGNSEKIEKSFINIPIDNVILLD